MRCSTHPEVETNLSCSKCLKPICPKCSVETPVGLRCRKCAQPAKVPALNVAALDYIKAMSVGLGASLVFGIVWLLIRLATPYIWLFNFFLAAAVGYGIGRVISLSVKRKRSRLLKIVAGFCMIVAFVIGNQLTFLGQFILAFNLFNLLALAVGVYLAVSHL